VSFRLSERSVVSYTLKKGKKKRSGSKVFNSGKQSFTFKHLSAGGYRVTLVGKDGFGHKGKSASKTFSVR
jgi:hypothetical protein